ncbi:MULTISPECIES: DUF3105 domain-containing protein [Streptomyces]|uniref:DUF3105 domain-containing protein n=1 Tax=Streptomyces glycanivorans TaxID=3033808 RepID=A0ABY9JK65_9ACTN|nr:MULTISPECIES: DUF3105 domain-containing protein [unclassified Streptomyces]WSQ80334.1 DUF3105 domain-containing protein [Streptomyces sp. NBC_01213]TXS08629.1 DUF3105 domain-containing protein [Streptomyces sp. wa22]WLQ66913.1 DUF3105 domain-containing protein [Streptomyces sp. Alt3]WSQ87666.1 DUF3105 domain-containing protein [Streptomyces sp. NBC_01212]WSR06325.1 DUF3105 domain-containing protein [Streptomyces sp. NBC_01208]
MSFDRRTRMEQMRSADRARDRRNKVLAIGVSAVVVAGLLGFGSYMLLEKSEAKERTEGSQAQDAKQTEQTEQQKKKLAAEPIADEKSWDAEKLTRDHVTTEVTYPMEPPVGGNHNPAWLNCDGVVYEKAVPNVNAVHALEHGAVWVTHNGKASPEDVDALASRVSSTPYSLMSPYEGQAGAIMLSAWGKQVTVDGADDPRVARFFAKYVQGAQTPEPGAPCTGGVDG